MSHDEAHPTPLKHLVAKTGLSHVVEQLEHGVAGAFSKAEDAVEHAGEAAVSTLAHGLESVTHIRHHKEGKEEAAALHAATNAAKGAAE